jgi:hypothetical protein
MNKRKRANHVECTACSNGSFAEHLHSHLHVPICGACKLSFSSRDENVEESNEQSCIWCGQGDGCELLMCDSCVLSFCTDCVTRNFGTQEAKFVKDLIYWNCYVCSVSPKLKDLQMEEKEFSLYSLDKAYSQVRPPVHGSVLDSVLVDRLRPQEKAFASIFSKELTTSTLHEVGIVSYFRARDVFSVIYCLSKSIRELLKSNIFFTPGLFQTDYGREFNCRLYPHQVASLYAMQCIENCDQSFGALRGGIFGDEPGLGKTVTVLALVASTAGLYPQRPATFWDDSCLEENFRNLRAEHGALLHPVLNKLAKSLVLGFEPPTFQAIRRRFNKADFNLRELDSAGSSAPPPAAAIRLLAPHLSRCM